MPAMYHVTSVANRESIEMHGLDWRRMGVAPGIAGSPCPERDGCFLAPDVWTAEYFVQMNNTGGPVDVWAVEGIDESDLVTSPEGYEYLPVDIPREKLQLVRKDIPPSRG
jgi:hypothetical protein